jgi:hypothetical protein
VGRFFCFNFLRILDNCLIFMLESSSF